MSDIVERLRDKNCCDTPNCNCDAAADEITALRSENEKLRATLWDIHAICNNYPHFFWWPVHRIKRRVRAALGGKDE